MYEDDPYFKMYDGIIYNTFIKHPIKYPIAGTVEDVRKITKEDLYTCYNTFYHPSNMFLVITGNVDPKEAMEVIKINQEKKKFDSKKEIEIKTYNEPDKVEKENEEITMDVEIPKVGIGYKINCSKMKLSINDIKIYLNILFDLKIGPTSLLNEKLKKLNLITHDIDFSMINTDKTVLIMPMIETNNPKKVIKLLDEELKNLYISESELERKKKVRKSNCIYRSDNIYSINNKIVGNIMNYNEVIEDDYKRIDELNIKTMNKIIEKLDLSNKTTYIINKP